ncbi:MAG: phage tail protein, partial [Brevinema sp.]
RNFVSQMVTEIKNKIYEFVNVGKHIVEGIIEGISSMVSKVVKTVENLASSALDGIRDFLGIASPAKAFIEIGKFCSLGMAEGIAKYAGNVVNETETLGDDVLSSMESTMTQLARAIETDMDVQPTITPVLDLSDVKSGANSLASMLNKGQTYGLAQKVSKQNSLKADDQNGSNMTDNSTTIHNKFELNGLTVRTEADIDEIAKKLYQKQQTSMRGKGLRPAYV